MPQDIGSGTSNVNFNASLADLLPNTIYHVQAVVVTGDVTTFGADQTFSTSVQVPALPNWGWVVLGAIFMARGWVKPDLEGKLYCLLGVSVSVGLWFTGLSWAISIGHRKFTEKTLVKMERLSGIGLIVFALAQGTYLDMKLAK